MSKDYLYLVSVAVSPNSLGQAPEAGAVQAFLVSTSAPLEAESAFEDVLNKLPVDSTFGPAHPLTLIAVSLVRAPRLATNRLFSVGAIAVAPFKR